jgi:hypothetical protein
MAFNLITPAKLSAPTSITTGLTTLFTVAAATLAMLKDMDICNTTGAPIAVTVYLVPSGASAGASNALLSSVSVPANSTLQWTGTQHLNAGDSVQVLAASTGLTIHCSGANAQ